MDLDCFARPPEFLLEIQEEVRMNCVFASRSAQRMKQSRVVQIASPPLGVRKDACWMLVWRSDVIEGDNLAIQPTGCFQSSTTGSCFRGTQMVKRLPLPGCESTSSSP